MGQYPFSFPFSPTLASELESGPDYLLHMWLGMGVCQMQPESCSKVQTSGAQPSRLPHEGHPRPLFTVIWSSVPGEAWLSWVVPLWHLQMGHEGESPWTTGSHLWCQGSLVSDNQLVFVSNNQIPKLVSDLLKKINSSGFKSFFINNCH